MGYGPQGGGGSSATGDNGFDVNQTPALTPGYKNVVVDSDRMTAASWTASNLTVTQRSNVLSPLGGNAVFDIDDSSANLGTLTQTVADAFENPDYSIAFIYVQIDPALSPNAAFRFEQTDGVSSSIGEVNINCTNAAEISSTQLNCGLVLEAIEVATQTWLKISYKSTLKFNTPCSFTVSITPAAAGAASQESAVVSSIQFVDWSIKQDVTSNFDPAYIGTGGAGTIAPVQPVRIPSGSVDWGQKIFDPGIAQYTLNMSSDLNRYLTVEDSGLSLTLPDLSGFSNPAQWNGFTCFIRDINVKGFFIDRANAAIDFEIIGAFRRDVNFPILIDPIANVTIWRLVLVDGAAQSWQLFPETLTHGTYVAVDGFAFMWPAGNVYLTGSGGGGGGGGGNGSFPGGGGGAGEAMFKEHISSAGASAGTLVSIQIGEGGAGGTSGNAGTDGTATVIDFGGGNTITLNGGGGGSPGAANSGNGGLGGSGGWPTFSGSQDGTRSPTGLGATNQGPPGGGNVAGGVGGVTRDNAASQGYNGGGGAGGNPTNRPGGDGGDGFLIIEW